MNLQRQNFTEHPDQMRFHSLSGKGYYSAGPSNNSKLLYGANFKITGGSYF